MPVLTSDRLILRPITLGDAADYLPTYGNAEAMRYLGNPWTMEQCSENAQANGERWAKYGFASWLVDLIDESGQRHTGVALLGFGAPHENGTVGFGWIVDPR